MSHLSQSTCPVWLRGIQRIRLYLNKSVEDLENLLLDENREDAGVGQHLTNELLDPGQEDVHRSKQRLSFVCLPVPERTQTQNYPKRIFKYIVILNKRITFVMGQYLFELSFRVAEVIFA